MQPPGVSTRDRAAQLAELYDSLRQRQAFSGEDEQCLTNYLEFKIKEGQVYPKCFFEKSSDKTACSAEISVEDIRTYVSEEVWQKYNKFKFNKEHELGRQCPYCDHSQICAGSDQPECVCEACKREFCFVHSSAHQGRTCVEYDKKMIAVEKLNNALISKISKPCPGCQNNVEKTGGCNQMNGGTSVAVQEIRWQTLRGKVLLKREQDLD
ncbi:hypothetical protein BBJ29_007888 [Phytophthora kernoviae]|uniref:RING-type domain-containing protein n=1 Tax=Phytophthora kernoviae TaxID=325452 RepID=A0A3F2RI44_9STRA|nr:hypothetical protein BBJ29_007888 [Phytophthora kernoviae]RLN56427.1 hypothetical protein BBP00_00008017 [Phytophthora kernoviae]